MRRISTGFIILCLVMTMIALPASAAEADYVGEWAACAIDVGDGVKLTEYEGSNVSNIMKIIFNEDGTLTVTSFGQQIPGSWTADETGINAEIDGQQVSFKTVDGQLVNESEGILIYLAKVVKPKSGGLLGALKANKFVGYWVATGIDQGDGLVTEWDNQSVPDKAITINPDGSWDIESINSDQVTINESNPNDTDMPTMMLNRDGTLTATSMGIELIGTWKEIDGGVSITIEGEVVDFTYENEMLSAIKSGVAVYFKREAKTTYEATALPTPMPAASVFVGDWSAAMYETGGYWYDVKLLFPDGCTLSFQEGGTASATITKEYTENLTWSEQDGALSVSGGYVLSDPEWDAATGELRMKYNGSDVFVVFVKGDAPEVTSEYGSINADATPLPEPEPAEEPVPTEALEPTSDPATAADADVQAFTSPLFAASFPAGWVSNEYSLSTDEGYCSVKYDLKNSEGASLSSIAIYASSESVDGYRDRIKRLTESAEKAGGALSETTIGGVMFLGTAYQNWGWNYIEYAARVPESRITLSVTIEQPENAGDSVQQVMDSIQFTLPKLDPPNVDPPMPEDGVPYEPTPASVEVGKYKLKASWIDPPGSIVLDSIFGNQIAIANKKMYVLAGKKLYAYALKSDKLTVDKMFEGGVMKLSDTFEYLSSVKDGTLYVSQGVFNTLALKDGKVLKDNSVSGDVVMHPGGKWGLSFWANADVKKVTAAKGMLTEEPWVLTGLSDPAARKGRFSMVSCVAISDKRIYVAGNDSKNGDAQRIAVFDLEGNELFTFGATEWTDDDAFGSVTGIVETKNGILVQDGNSRAYKLFSKDGAFIGSVDADALLGTSYPWLSSMIPADNGVYVAGAQRRNDQSCDELLIFKITGF